MAEQKTGASYLDRRPFVINKDTLSAWGPWAMALGIVASIGLVYLVLIVAYVLMVIGSGPAAPQPAELDSQRADAVERVLQAMDDPGGIQRIGFLHDSQEHYFFDQNKSGETLLVITGRVRNEYPEPRRHIRLRAYLLDADEKEIKHRDFYAGNVLPEEKLVELDPYAVYSRLDIRSGIDGINLNVAPGAEIPFMIVFDRLPESMSEYRIDVIGSERVPVAR